MYNSIDVVDFFIEMVNSLKSEDINLNSSLEEISIKAGKNDFAYIDNRKDALNKYGCDFWGNTKKLFKNETAFIHKIKATVNENLLYSKSEQFPDFMLKVRKHSGKLICGSLLELKDSKGGSIASFNSTLPTKYKNLEELDIINGKSLVSRIAHILDTDLSGEKSYNSFERRNFYLIRTHAGNEEKVRISVVDGSFFETVPKDHLIYQMFLNVFRSHLEKKEINISQDALKEFEKTLSAITDQTLIASSQIIEKASVRPRLRIMAEVHPEGNPHGRHYPKITERSVNLILESSPHVIDLNKQISQAIPEIDTITIKHKRNGDHIVFQLRF
ncbi:MAG: hypothetical protein IID12_09535 [Candidatus Marinimicrobia bacterium]|nr:hypothetical protein [Candidatus Neomarinimicrobiota bacterium]